MSFLPHLTLQSQLSTKEILEIANQSESPTFANTIVSLEKAGKTLSRIETIFGVYTSNLNTGSIPDIDKAVAPKLSKYYDSIVQNSKLFERIESLYKGAEYQSLTAPQKRLVKDYYDDFVRQGSKLSPEEKQVLSQKNASLATMFSDFSQRVLEDEEGYVTWISDEAELDGLPQSTIDAMAGRGREAFWQWRVNGQVGDYQHTLIHGTVFDLCKNSEATRKGLAEVLQPR